MEPHYYHVNINWNQDRKGVMCSPELNAPANGANGCIEVATPPEFPKGIPGIWSPEHLFTAAISSCLMTTFLAIAENSKLEFLSFQCQSTGKLEQVDGKFLMSEILTKGGATRTRMRLEVFPPLRRMVRLTTGLRCRLFRSTTNHCKLGQLVVKVPGYLRHFH